MASPSRTRRGVRIGSVALLLATACHGRASTLNPAGPGAGRSAALWWSFATVSGLVFLLVVGYLFWGLGRRRRERGEEPIVDDSGGMGWVLGGGIVLPVVAIVAVFIVTLVALRAQAREGADARAAGGPVIDVVGHRWWWQVTYRKEGFTTANELHLPVGVPVIVNVSSADVIHSFWVPSLQRKIDAIPGRTNQIVLQADRTGVFRGECAEYCGLQHANMAFEVVAQSQTDYNAWVQQQQTTPPVPTKGLAFQGMQVLLGSDCVYCHTIAGTNASGTIGPDLTHVASRSTLAGGAIPNDPGHLAGWILDPQAIKPGVLMPATSLSAGEERELLAYLETLT